MEPSELEIEMLETSTALHRRAGRERAALLADWLAALWRAGMKLAAWTARPRRSRAADAIHAA
jgi:hypothetical protein